MNRIFKLFPVWVWVGLGVLVVALVSELTSPKPTPKKVLTQKPKKNLVTAFNDFELKLTATDPNGLSVGRVEQFKQSELIYVTAGLDYIKASRVERGELITAVRDAWGSECGCNPVVIFKTKEGQNLTKITATGKPEHVDP